MGVRSTGRKLAMKILYQKDLRPDDLNDIIEQFFCDSNYTDDTKNWAIELSEAVYNKIDDCDEIITRYAIDWDIERVNLIDKNILRIAIYELKHTETPINIILNEAIEISKKCSTDEAPKFINGILGNFVKKECSQD